MKLRWHKILISPHENQAIASQKVIACFKASHEADDGNSTKVYSSKKSIYVYTNNRAFIKNLNYPPTGIQPPPLSELEEIAST